MKFQCALVAMRKLSSMPVLYDDLVIALMAFDSGMGTAINTPIICLARKRNEDK